MILNTNVFFSPEEIENYRLNKLYGYSESYIPKENKFIHKWQENYKLSYYGIYTEDFRDIELERSKLLTEYTRKINENNGTKDEIAEIKNNCIMLGWNPNFLYLREMTNHTLFDMDSEIEDLEIVDEATKKENTNVLYIVLSFTNSAFGNVITRVTGSKYSHAALALDAKLDKLYTFNADVDGFKVESLEGYKKSFDNALLAVYAIMVKPKSFKKVKDTIENYITKAKTTSYSFLTGLGAVLGVPIERNDSMICSQFVDSILKMVNVEALEKNSALVVPGDFSHAKKLYKVFEGKAKNYNYKKVLANIKKKFVIEETILEAKEFPAGFDKDGNLILRNIKKLNYEEEYQKSHKLLKNYSQTENYGEAMAFELSKLWLMNTEIERKIFHSNISEDEKEKLFKTRTRILNDFNQYLKELLNHQKDFNFTEYYNNTPFSDAAVKIDKYTIKYGIEYGKSVLKGLI